MLKVERLSRGCAQSGTSAGRADTCVIMDFENLIDEALCRPSNHISYYVSQRLAESYPDRKIVEGGNSAFCLRSFARSGQCSIIANESIHEQTETDWQGLHRKLTHEAQNGWFNVLWQDHMIDVVFMTFNDEYRSLHYWILADTREIAEAFFRAVCSWCAEVRGEILVFDGGRWSKSEELYQAIKAATFDNLILPARLKEEIQADFALFFASREMYQRYRIPWKRGILLIGPPGNGKTHTVKALVNQEKRPCLYVKSFRSGHGTEHDNIRTVFARARQTTPCVVVLEDLDSLIDNKSRSFFLNELDGFASNTGVVVLATTNYPERLDPAILDRPSRFDRKYFFDLPARAERLEYARVWNDTLEPELKLSEASLCQAAEQTEGFSFAYMKEMFLSAMMQWISSPVSGGMDSCVRNRAEALREQMSNMNESPVALYVNEGE